MKVKNKNKKRQELKEIIINDKNSNNNDKDKDNNLKDNNNNEDKSKTFLINLYIPLIFSGFIYMMLNSVNFLIQIEPDYLLKLSIDEQTIKLKKKIKMNKFSQKFILTILLINILSKSFGHIITNVKIFKKRIDIILLMSIGISFFCNLFLFLTKTTYNIIFIIHIFFSFSSGFFFVPLIKINWTFLPFNEGLGSGVFNSFEYFSIIFLSLINKFLDMKYLLLTNIIFNFIIFILTIYLKNKYKGFFYGKSSYLYFSLEDKNEKTTDPDLVQNLMKPEEEDKEEENKKNKNIIKNSENEDNENEDEKMEQFDTDKEEEENDEDIVEKKRVFVQNLISDLSSKRFILLIVTYLLLLFSNYIISLIYLPFSIIFNLKMFFNSSIHLTIYITIYCFSSLFFGISFDLKNVRYLIVRLISLSVLSILLFFPTKYFSYIIDLLSILNAVSLSGIKTIMYPLVYREFFNNEGNYYLISIFIISEILVYTLTPIILKYFAFELTDFIMIFITCIAMLFGGLFIMVKKLFPIIIDSSDNYDINTKRGQGLKQLSLQDELPPLSKE